MKPGSLVILGKRYEIEYVDRPSDVDMHRRQALWGQVDYWTRTIRIYDHGRALEDLWHTILHEVIHALADELKLRIGKPENHDELDLLALGLADVIFRNQLFREPAQ